jgi:hypothetical protein
VGIATANGGEGKTHIQAMLSLAQRLPETAHAQGVQTFGVNQIKGGGKHQFPAQPCLPWGRRAAGVSREGMNDPSCRLCRAVPLSGDESLLIGSSTPKVYSVEMLSTWFHWGSGFARPPWPLSTSGGSHEPKQPDLTFLSASEVKSRLNLTAAPAHSVPANLSSFLFSLSENPARIRQFRSMSLCSALSLRPL